MNKDAESWSNVKPEIVVEGSKAQIRNVLQMALDDIATLDRLATAAFARGRREGLEEAARLAGEHRTEAALERHKSIDGDEKACWLWAFDTAIGIERSIRALIEAPEAAKP